MEVRRQCNRYREEPYGTDFDNVVRRAKLFYKDGTFLVSKFKHIYCAQRPAIKPYKDPDGAVYFEKVGHRWERRDKEVKERG